MSEYAPDRVSTIDELVMLDSGTVLRGPDWHAEVYVKFSDVEFYATGSDTPYKANEVQARGPFTLLWPLAGGCSTVSVDATVRRGAKAILDAAGVLPEHRDEDMWSLAERDASAVIESLKPDPWEEVPDVT